VESLVTEVQRFLEKASGQASSELEGEKGSSERDPEPVPSTVTELDRFLEVVRSLNQRLDEPTKLEQRGVRIVNCGRGALTVRFGAGQMQLEGGGERKFEATLAERPSPNPGLPISPTRFLHLLVENRSSDEGTLKIDTATVDPRTPEGLTVLVASANRKDWRFREVIGSATFMIPTSASIVVIGIGFSVNPHLVLNALSHDRDR